MSSSVFESKKDVEESKLVQSNPRVPGSPVKSSTSESPPMSIPIITSALEQQDADSLLLWLVRYPVERNHPRPITGTIPLWRSGEAVTCQYNEKVTKVLQKLVVEGFLSAPVLDAYRRFIGFVDLLDLVHWTVRSFEVWYGGVSVPATAAPTIDYWNSFFNLEKFQSASVDEIVIRPTSGYPVQMAYPVQKSFSLFHCIELMARYGVHRVPVLEKNQTVVGIITESMIISLLSQNLFRLGQLRWTPVSQITPILTQQVITINESATAIEGFKLMVEKNITGIAVVDDNGKLVNTLSVRELRGIGTNGELFTRLWLSIKTFKDLVKRDYPAQTPNRVLFVTPQNSLQDVINGMYDGNIHRLWVVPSAQDQRPISVISQRDVMRFLLAKMQLICPEV